MLHGVMSHPAAADGHLPSSKDSIGDSASFVVLYHELRLLARRILAGESKHHTLPPTALVHEVWLRLRAIDVRSPEGRAHFRRVATQAMRRVLIDHARGKQRQKRGGNLVRVSMDAAEILETGDLGDLLALDEVIECLEKEDAALAEIVRLRFYAGLDIDEVARELAMSPRSVSREWAYAKARLVSLLRGTTPEAPDRSGT